jgi:hypothetical protein
VFLESIAPTLQIMSDGHDAKADARNGPGLEPDPWRLNEESRRRQLREDGRRPLSVNLAEGLALSEFLSTFTGSARH